MRKTEYKNRYRAVVYDYKDFHPFLSEAYYRKDQAEKFAKDWIGDRAEAYYEIVQVL